MAYWNGENRRQTAEVRAVQVVQLFEIVKTGQIEELDDQGKRGRAWGEPDFSFDMIVAYIYNVDQMDNKAI